MTVFSNLSGRARVFESQDEAVEAILSDKIVAGDVVVIVFEGPKGGPGCRKCCIQPATLNLKGWVKNAHC